MHHSLMPQVPAFESQATGFSHVLKDKVQLADKSCACWEGYERVPGTTPCAPGSCTKTKKGDLMVHAGRQNFLSSLLHKD